MDAENYRNVRNELNGLIRRSKREKEIRLANSRTKDPKNFYKYFKANSKKKERVGPLIVENRVVESDKEMVEFINAYFSSVFTLDSESIPIFESTKKPPVYFDTVSFTRATIINAVKGMNPNKSAGPDGIHSRILKEGIDFISEALYIIFKRSLDYAEIPEDWKCGHVVPLFKKGSKNSVNNYRPVSITSVVCKLLEKIIKDVLTSFLDSNSIITPAQHGFRKGKSCLSNLLEFLEFVTDHVDQGRDVDIIYLDFSKAFDKVSHRNLAIKLQGLGIVGSIQSWIREWLNERKQRVILNGTKSSWRDVISGVPQGSVLGPLLFILYLNDLENCISSKVYKFADDTKIARPIVNTNDNAKLQRDLDRMISWADKWQMEFNCSKCKVLHVGNRNTNFNYELEGSWLENCDKEKDLGVIIDRDLKFSQQCLEARNRANKMLGFINRNVSYKSKEVVIQLFNSYVRPYLEYCVQAWRPYHKHNINILEAVQRRATKLVPGLKHLSYSDRLKNLNMFSVERRFIRGDMIEIYKMLKGQVSLNFNEFFTLADDSRCRGHSYKIKKNYCRLDVRKNFFSQRVVKLWNDLPQEVLDSSSLNVFKGRLDGYMNSI